MGSAFSSSSSANDGTRSATFHGEGAASGGFTMTVRRRETPYFLALFFTRLSPKVSDDLIKRLDQHRSTSRPKQRRPQQPPPQQQQQHTKVVIDMSDDDVNKMRSLPAEHIRTVLNTVYQQGLQQGLNDAGRSAGPSSSPTTPLRPKEADLQPELLLEKEKAQIESLKLRLASIRPPRAANTSPANAAKIETARQAVLQCYKLNTSTPLNCAVEVQDFFAAVKEAQMEFVQSA